MRKRIEAACAHELTFGRMTSEGGFIDGPSWVWVLKCTLLEHKPESCEKHGVTWCKRCGVDLGT
jgi:hypothetical protein